MEKKKLAQFIDHSILNPIYTDSDLLRECDIAKKYKVATVCVKPYCVSRVVDIMKDSSVKVCTVIGFPHGNSSIKSKEFEAVEAIQNGAQEIDMLINIAKVIEQDWEYIYKEIATVSCHCKKSGIILKVIFENAFLTDKNLIVKLCEICSDINVDYVKTSTGYAFIKGVNGFYPSGANLDDCKLMINSVRADVKVKAAGGIRTYEDALAYINIGVKRIGTTATESMLS